MLQFQFSVFVLSCFFWVLLPHQIKLAEDSNFPVTVNVNVMDYLWVCLTLWWTDDLTFPARPCFLFNTEIPASCTATRYINPFWRVQTTANKHSLYKKFLFCAIIDLCALCFSSADRFLPLDADLLVLPHFSPAHRFWPCPVSPQRHTCFKERQWGGRGYDQLHATGGVWHIIQPHASLWYLQVQQHWTAAWMIVYYLSRNK